MNILNILKQIPVFHSLSSKELELLSDVSNVVNYKEGNTLFTQGDISKNVLILIDGIVSIYKHNSKGDEIVIGYFHRYAFLAEAAILKHIQLPSTARFHSDGAVIQIPLGKFEGFLKEYPKLSYEVILSLLDKVDLLQQNIHFNLASNSKEKVLNFYKKSSKLAVDLKRYEIASLLGITPETFSRVTKQLLEEKKLIQQGSTLKINS
ncbi:MAG: Crp/Fnr family transcriptional regulator [Campylobacterota bacterium]|nr:Crp/Fnr family transcriptional regulator [Campylobacterota bacterium]